jgi:hypothetical protein
LEISAISRTVTSNWVIAATVSSVAIWIMAIWLA